MAGYIENPVNQEGPSPLQRAGRVAVGVGRQKLQKYKQDKLIRSILEDPEVGKIVPDKVKDWILNRAPSPSDGLKVYFGLADKRLGEPVKKWATVMAKLKTAFPQKDYRAQDIIGFASEAGADPDVALRTIKVLGLDAKEESGGESSADRTQRKSNLYAIQYLNDMTFPSTGPSGAFFQPPISQKEQIVNVLSKTKADPESPEVRVAVERALDKLNMAPEEKRNWLNDIYNAVKGVVGASVEKPGNAQVGDIIERGGRRLKIITLSPDGNHEVEEVR